MTDDCHFAYASDTAENSGRNLGHIVKLSFWTFSSSKLCILTLMKFLYGNKAINSFFKKNFTLPTLPFYEKIFMEAQRFIVSLECKLTKFVSQILWTCVRLVLTVYFGAPSMFITLWFGFDYGTNPPLGTLII
jgi:hypothetical protein